MTVVGHRGDRTYNADIGVSAAARQAYIDD
jgi:hypothetical protein